MNPFLVWGGLAAGAAGLYYLASHKPMRFLGDKAVVGDDVFVPIAVGGPAFPGVPTNAGQLVVNVKELRGSDLLIGPVVGWALAGASAAGFAPLPPSSDQSVNRAVVTAIRHGNTLVTA